MAILFTKVKKAQRGILTNTIDQSAKFVKNALNKKQEDYNRLMKDNSYRSDAIKFIGGKGYNKLGNEVPFYKSQYAENPNKWFALTSGTTFDNAAKQFPVLYGESVNPPTEGMRWIQPKDMAPFYSKLSSGDYSDLKEDTLLGYLKHGDQSYPVNYAQYQRLSPIIGDLIGGDKQTWQNLMLNKKH